MEEITDEPKSLVAKDSIFRLPSVKASMSFPLSNMDYKKGMPLEAIFTFIFVYVYLDSWADVDIMIS